MRYCRHCLKHRLCTTQNSKNRHGQAVQTNVGMKADNVSGINIGNGTFKWAKFRRTPTALCVMQVHDALALVMGNMFVALMEVTTVYLGQ